MKKSNIVVKKDSQLPSLQGRYHRLLCMTGKNKGMAYYLEGKRAVMGRSQDTDIQILDPLASKQHVELVLQGEFYILTDLNSHNGVMVNGKKTIQKKLDENDNIIVGQTVFKYSKVDVKKQQKLKNPEKKKKKKNPYLIAAVAIVVIFLFDTDDKKTPEEEKTNEISNRFLLNSKNRKRKLKHDEGHERHVASIIHRGLREHREGNYFRAISEFNRALVVDPDNARASFYLRKTKKSLDEEIEINFIRAKKEIDALKYKSAIVSYCAILRLLQGYNEDKRYRNALKNLETIKEQTKMESHDIDCLPKQ